MPGALVPGGPDKSFPIPVKAFDSAKDAIPDPLGWAALFWVVAHFLPFLPARGRAAGWASRLGALDPARSGRGRRA